MQTEEITLALEEALAHRESLLESAAQGAAVTAQVLRAAEQAVRDAETDLMLAGAVGRHERSNAERERIAAHEAAGVALASEFAAAIAADADAATKLNDALTEARIFVDRKNATALAVRNVDLKILAHNELLLAEAKTNAVLRAIPRPEWPRLVAVSAGGLRVGAPLRIEIVQHRQGYQPDRVAGDVVLVGPVKPLIQESVPAKAA